MISFRLIPDQTSFPFLRYRHLAFALSGALVAISLLLLPTKGLNFGIDFQGGTMVEVRMPGESADLAGMRTVLGGLGLGEVALGPADGQLVKLGDCQPLALLVESRAEAAGTIAGREALQSDLVMIHGMADGLECRPHVGLQACERRQLAGGGIRGGFTGFAHAVRELP